MASWRKRSKLGNASYNVVKANELIKIWLKSCDIILKSVNVLGNMYFNDLCLWMYSKRTFQI